MTDPESVEPWHGYSTRSPVPRPPSRSSGASCAGSLGTAMLEGVRETYLDLRVRPGPLRYAMWISMLAPHVECIERFLPRPLP